MEYLKDKTKVARVYMEGYTQQVEYVTLYAFFAVFYENGKPSFFADFWVEDTDSGIAAAKKHLCEAYEYIGWVKPGKADDEVEILVQMENGKDVLLPAKIMTAKQFTVKDRKKYEHAFTM